MYSLLIYVSNVQMWGFSSAQRDTTSLGVSILNNNDNDSVLHTDKWDLMEGSAYFFTRMYL